jgi:hypothetical protein
VCRDAGGRRSAVKICFHLDRDDRDRIASEPSR